MSGSSSRSAYKGSAPGIVWESSAALCSFGQVVPDERGVELNAGGMLDWRVDRPTVKQALIHSGLWHQESVVMKPWTCYPMSGIKVHGERMLTG